MRLVALVLLTVWSIVALEQVPEVTKAAGDPNATATILYAAGAFLGVIFTGVTGLITALGANRKAREAKEQSIKNGEKAQEIATKVDGASSRQDQLIAQLQSDLKSMHDELMNVSRERVADAKESAVQAASVAATAAAEAAKVPNPLPVVMTDRRGKDEAMK